MAGMGDRVPLRWTVLLPAAVYVAGAAVQVAIGVVSGSGDPPGASVAMLIALGTPVAVGCLLGWRVPNSPVAAALAWVGAAPAAVFAVEMWGESARTARPWPMSELLFHVQLGAWVWNLAGFAALCLLFPAGLLPGRRWRALAWAAVAVGVYVNALQALVGLPGEGQPVTLPVAGVVVLGGVGFALCLAALGATVASL